MNGWQLDKKVPIALILAMVVQFAGIVWWGGTINATVSDHERRIVAVEAQKVSERLATLEAQLANVQNGVSRLDQKLDRLIERDRK